MFCRKSRDVDHDRIAKRGSRRLQLFAREVNIPSKMPRTFIFSDLLGRLMSDMNVNGITLSKKTFHDTCKLIQAAKG